MIEKFDGLYECCCCGRTWREWYGRTAAELHESMNRHEDWLGHRVHYVDQPRMVGAHSSRAASSSFGRELHS